MREQQKIYVVSSNANIILVKNMEAREIGYKYQ